MTHFDFGGAGRLHPVRRRRWRGALGCLLLLALGGCAVFKGRPEPPFSEALYTSATSCGRKAAAEQGCADTPLLKQQEIVDLVNATDRTRRDRIVEHALSLMALRYSRFKEDFVANRKHLRAGIGALSLMLNLAGTLTDATIPLQNYSVGSALLNGVGQNIDTNYLLNLTAEALITQMDASRSEVELRIRQGMRQDIDVYSGGQALRDLVEYFNAGTFLGAIRHTSAQGSQQNEANQAKLVTLRIAGNDEIRSIATITNRLAALPDDAVTRGTLADILVKVQVTPTPGADKAALAQQLNDYRFAVATDAQKSADVEKLILNSGLFDKEH